MSSPYLQQFPSGRTLLGNVVGGQAGGRIALGFKFGRRMHGSGGHGHPTQSNNVNDLHLRCWPYHPGKTSITRDIVSRLARKTANDADRLQKYLARFDLTWDDVRAPRA